MKGMIKCLILISKTILKNAKNKLEKKIIAALIEAAGEFVNSAARNTPEDTGQLKGSWDYHVDESKLTASIGSPLENAIWNEFGTGEYALKGDGRKGGWYVPGNKLSAKAKSKMRKVIIKGKEFYFTRGKLPRRSLFKSEQENKNTLQKALDNKFKDMK